MYFPANANDTTAEVCQNTMLSLALLTFEQSFLTDFLQTGDDLPLTIKGDSGSSPFASLQPALEGVSISTSVKGQPLFHPDD